jgi:ABC-type uncharacterized transport system permease subunit
MLRPPVPASIGWAFVVVAAAMATAAVVTAAVVTARRGGPRLVEPVLSGLLAAVVAALVIEPVVATMLRFGPDSWVPRMTSYALTPAAQLAERRHLSAEPYLLVSLLGAALALMLGVLALRTRGRVRTIPPDRPVDRPRHIELGEA